MVKKLNFASFLYWAGVVLSYAVIVSMAVYYYQMLQPLEIFPNRENHILIWTAVFIVVSLIELKQNFLRGVQELTVPGNGASVFLRQWTCLLTLMAVFVFLMAFLRGAEVWVVRFMQLFIF